MWFTLTFTEFSKSFFTGEVVPYVGNEIHALSSAIKPVCTWAVRDAIQDCREATGGHGYLKGIELEYSMIKIEFWFAFFN